MKSDLTLTIFVIPKWREVHILSGMPIEFENLFTGTNGWRTLEELNGVFRFRDFRSFDPNMDKYMWLDWFGQWLSNFDIEWTLEDEDNGTYQFRLKVQQ